MIFQRRTTYELRVEVWHDLHGEEYHSVYLWAIERPKNRVPRQTPRRVSVHRPVRQPGINRKGRHDNNHV